MLRCTVLPAAAFVAGAVFLFPVLASAQQPGEDQKPPEQTQGEQKQEGKAENEQKAAEEDKAEQEAATQAIAEFEEAAAKLLPSAGSAECVWTGRRIASLLWRDDIDTARRYIDLYDRFNCSSEHLKLVFRCVIKQGPLDPKAADRLASRVHGCWVTPEGETTAASQETVGTAVKPKTVPN
ncbi:MAG TPA: hypothetical protein VFR60_06865 [Sphingomicrobium sp.]|jgi:hypothetical protein|nr:hypothetical protein [Sphingomicrobium sp.]